MRMSRKEERKKETKLAKDYINALLRTALNISILSRLLYTVGPMKKENFSMEHIFYTNFS
jgi:hypothetical protein